MYKHSLIWSQTAGIVLPNGDAQKMLIQDTYKLAGLDPVDTQYVELHGTGTKVGDPAEVGAVSKTIASLREEPLYCGSVKTQIGHTEGAAGVAAVIKCVLAMENGIIPPSLNFVKPNPRLRLGTSNIIIPTAPVPWPECDVRRCSINNFGFGGTNAHVIMDGGQDFLRQRGLAPQRANPTNQPARLFVLSAPEQDAISRQREAYANYTATLDLPETLPNLAYTLSKRRSVFQWRHAVVASSVHELMTQWKDDTLKPSKAGTNSKVAFIFTGQGAQWYAMGRELAPFDVFQSSVRISAAYLKASLGCSWDAWDELMASESESKVNRAEFSQPLCLVLQMALVDLLEYWGIKPSSVVGHSSGEIAAAYSAKALTREDCLRIAYYRGLASELAKRRNPHGSMMAVGLSKVEVEPYLFNSVVLACVNSPSSVTIAGEKSDLEQLQISFKDEGIFCRVLQVENAYHSPLMLSVSEEYRNNIRDIAPRDSSVAFHSSVKGSQVPTSQLHADYWVENMCSTVEFVAAMDNMMYSNVERRELKRKAEAPSHLLEVGPHAALKGPIKQFKAARDGLEHLSYESALLRGEAASVTAISAAGSLWTKGVHVDLDKV